MNEKTHGAKFEVNVCLTDMQQSPARGRRRRGGGEGLGREKEGDETGEGRNASGIRKYRYDGYRCRRNTLPP